jgi:hypothetical protein
MLKISLFLFFLMFCVLSFVETKNVPSWILPALAGFVAVAIVFDFTSDWRKRP